MQAKTPIPDPQGTSALKWIVEGVKDGSKGAWELIVDPNTQTIWHLLWISM